MLRQRWVECFRCLLLVPPRGTFEALVERYGEPHRAYHTLQHIEECFAQFERVHEMDSPGALGLALWFHDAIYEPWASDNETRSATWARSVLIESRAPEGVIEAVERMILATRHDVVVAGHDDQIVVDIDLSILGAEDERCREYEAQIRREYGGVEDSAFRSARTKILQRFLNQPFIFSTEFFRTQIEVKARQNIQRSIERLQGDRS